MADLFKKVGKKQAPVNKKSFEDFAVEAIRSPNLIKILEKKDPYARKLLDIFNKLSTKKRLLEYFNYLDLVEAAHSDENLKDFMEIKSANPGDQQDSLSDDEIEILGLGAKHGGYKKNQSSSSSGSEEGMLSESSGSISSIDDNQSIPDKEDKKEKDLSIPGFINKYGSVDEDDVFNPVPLKKAHMKTGDDVEEEDYDSLVLLNERIENEKKKLEKAMDKEDRVTEEQLYNGIQKLQEEYEKIAKKRILIKHKNEEKPTNLPFVNRRLQRLYNKETSEGETTMDKLNRVVEYRIKSFKEVKWLKTPNKHVVEIYVDDRTFHKKDYNQSIVFMGKTWYPANNEFFKILATSRYMFQKDENLEIITHEGRKISVSILYRFNDNSAVVQNEHTFLLQQQYFQKLTAPVETQVQAIMETVFTTDMTNLRNFGKSYLNVPDQNIQENIIANKMHGNTIREYFNEIAKIYVYLGDTIFSDRLGLGYYKNMDLTLLTSFDKCDYPQLQEYYESIIPLVTNIMGFDYFTFDTGRKAPSNIVIPARPVLETENVQGNYIVYNGKLIQVRDALSSGDLDKAFIAKINKMLPKGAIYEKPVIKKNLWDYVENALSYLESNGVKTLDDWNPSR